ncbi:unnamed protein product [Cunninghamella echinulata]
MMKGTCFFSIAYIILVNPYLLSTLGHQENGCLSEMNTGNGFSFSIARLSSLDDNLAMNHDVNNDDDENFTALYQLATNACYEGCKKAQIMTFSGEFLNSQTPLTVLDSQHTKLSDADFFLPNEAYLVNYFDTNHEDGPSGLGCFELEDKLKFIHYPYGHPACKKAKSVVCGEKKGVLLKSTSLNLDDGDEKNENHIKGNNPYIDIQEYYINENIKLNIHYLKNKKSSNNSTAPNTGHLNNTNNIINNDNDTMETERKGNANLTNIEVQSSKDMNYPKNIARRTKRNRHKKRLSYKLQQKLIRRSNSKKKAVIDHRRKNTSQITLLDHANNNTNTMMDIKMEPMNDNNHTFINIKNTSNHSLTNITADDNGDTNKTTTTPSPSPSPAAAAAVETASTNKQNDIYDDNDLLNTPLSNGDESYNIVRLPGSIESLSTASDICQQQFEENHLGSVQSDTFQEISTHFRAHHPSTSNMIVSSWNGDTYGASNPKECLMYNSKSGIRVASCSEATDVLCVKSLNNY